MGYPFDDYSDEYDSDGLTGCPCGICYGGGGHSDDEDGFYDSIFW